MSFAFKEEKNVKNATKKTFIRKKTLFLLFWLLQKRLCCHGLFQKLKAALDRDIKGLFISYKNYETSDLSNPYNYCIFTLFLTK